MNGCGITGLVAWAAFGAAVGLGLVPIFHHLAFGLRERRQEILSYFGHDSIVKYFKQFYQNEWQQLSNKSDAEIYSAFKGIYDRRFGFRTFTGPLILYFLSLITSAAAIAYTALNGSLEWKGATLDIKGEYALAGAYLWVVLDLIACYRQRDLVPSALYWYSFRFVISIPLAYAVTTLLAPAAAPPVAFALGAFPTSTLMLFLRRQAAQRLGLSDDAGTRKLELEALQGVNTTIAEKFAEIGIMTMLQLAYEDPIQLTMRTNLSFSFITDVISQALAIIYGLDLNVARQYSVRGAFEAAEVFEDYNSTDPEVKARADAVIAELAAQLHRPERIIQKILYDVHEDPYTDFLREIWQ